MDKQHESDLLTTKEAAKYLRLEKVTLDIWRRTGKVLIPYCKIGRCIRYRKQSLDDFLDASEIKN